MPPSIAPFGIETCFCSSKKRVWYRPSIAPFGIETAGVKQTQRGLQAPSIAPFGIETLKTNQSCYWPRRPSIAPFGIETVLVVRQARKRNHLQSHLLVLKRALFGVNVNDICPPSIAPFGIETPKKWGMSCRRPRLQSHLLVLKHELMVSRIPEKETFNRTFWYWNVFKTHHVRLAVRTFNRTFWYWNWKPFAEWKQRHSLQSHLLVLKLYAEWNTRAPYLCLQSHLLVLKQSQVSLVKTIKQQPSIAPFGIETTPRIVPHDFDNVPSIAPFGIET